MVHRLVFMQTITHVRIFPAAIADKFTVRNINHAYIKWGIKDGDSITG